MSGFVSYPPPAPPPAVVLEHDGWFPSVDLTKLRDAQRISTAVTDDRLKDAVLSAMVTVGRELRAWKAARVAEGRANLAAVPADQVGTETQLVFLYRRAIHAFASAELVETHNDISASADGKERTEERVLTADEHRRNGVHAIRDILGTTRTAVELI